MRPVFRDDFGGNGAKIFLKFQGSLHRSVHILVCMGRTLAEATDKGAIVMTEKRGTAWKTDPQPQDVDDLIFWGQSGPQVSQR